MKLTVKIDSTHIRVHLWTEKGELKLQLFKTIKTNGKFTINAKPGDGDGNPLLDANSNDVPLPAALQVSSSDTSLLNVSVTDGANALAVAVEGTQGTAPGTTVTITATDGVQTSTIEVTIDPVVVAPAEESLVLTLGDEEVQ